MMDIMNSIKTLLFFTAVILLAGCTTYYVGQKTFLSERKALDFMEYQCGKGLAEFQSYSYRGGSVLLHVLSNETLASPPFTATGQRDNQPLSFRINTFRHQFSCLYKYLHKSQIFDSVKEGKVKGYIRHAKLYGYRYVVAIAGDGWRFYDLVLGKEEKINFLVGYEDIVDKIAFLIDKFNKIKATPIARNYGKELPSTQYEYNSVTKKGRLSVPSSGITGRAILLSQIGAVCSSKNIIMESGKEKHAGGRYSVLDESIKNGSLSIHFRCDW